MNRSACGVRHLSSGCTRSPGCCSIESLFKHRAAVVRCCIGAGFMLPVCAQLSYIAHDSADSMPSRNMCRPCAAPRVFRSHWRRRTSSLYHSSVSGWLVDTDAATSELREVRHATRTSTARVHTPHHHQDQVHHIVCGTRKRRGR